MSKKWVMRQRRTNNLVRLLANYVLRDNVTPRQLYGLCQLTWITNNYIGQDAAYVFSTKIPGLSNVMGRDYSRLSLTEIADTITAQIGESSLKDLVLQDSGFTNFYNAYRDSSLSWIQNNFNAVLPLFENVVSLVNDGQGLQIIQDIAALPRIPRGESSIPSGKPESLLTPVFFCLDSRIRFPIINGNDRVRVLLRKLDVSAKSLGDQYLKMITMLGIDGIEDAADLDQLGDDLPDFIDAPGKPATKKLLQRKPLTEGTALNLKDEQDINFLLKTKEIIQKRMHNGLTNKLKDKLGNFTLLEGASDFAMFDVLVKDFDESGNDLMIEVKSAADIANVRMAIGQLFDYWFRLKGNSDKHLSILLPEEPNMQIKGLLNWLNISLLWFSGEVLQTSSDSLNSFVSKVK